MKKISFLIIVIVLSSITHSCKENNLYVNKKIEYFTDNDFPEIVNLKVEQIDDIDIDSIMFPSSFELVGDYIIIGDEKSENAFHVINIINNKYLGSYVNRGEGKGEVTVPWDISYINDNSFLINDIAQKKSLECYLDSDGITVSKEILVNQLGFSYSVFKSNDDLYYTNFTGGNKRVYKQNILTQNTKGYGSLLSVKGYENIEHLSAQLSASRMGHNDKTISFYYQEVPLIELFDIENNKWFSFVGPNNSLPDYKVMDNEGHTTIASGSESLIGYADIDVTDNYTYALYSGRKVGESFLPKGNSIYVFENNGSLIKKIQLDHDISRLEVYNDSIIYGLNVDIKPELVKINI